MPTPEAVLQAAELLSNGFEDEEGVECNEDGSAL